MKIYKQGMFIIQLLLIYSLLFVSAGVQAKIVEPGKACKKYTETKLNKIRNEQGVDVIEISNCDQTRYPVEKSKNEQTMIANAFSGMIMEESWLDLDIQVVENFFSEHKSAHDISLIYQAKRVIYKESKKTHIEPSLFGKRKEVTVSTRSWYVDTSLENSLWDMYLVSDAAEDLDYIYKNYNDELKQLLDDRSYFLYSLLAGNTGLTKDDFSVWDYTRYYKNTDRQNEISQLLDILIATKRYEQLERYLPLLEKDYEGNPFKYFFLTTNFHFMMPDIFKEIEQLRDWGIDFFHYSNKYDIQNIHSDNLALSIVHDLTDGKDYSLIQELASNLTSCNSECLRFYMELAITEHDPSMVGTLFDSLPHTEYTDEEISRLIWLAAKYSDTSIMKALFEAFKLPEYMDFQDGEGGLSALGYAKENRNEEMIGILEMHGYQSNSIKDFFRNTKRGLSNTKETVNGVGYVIQLLLFGYH